MQLADLHDENIDAILEHYGIRGMKWGVRRGSSRTGVSRARGAAIDRNDRAIRRIQDSQKGKGPIRFRIERKLNQIAMGESATKRLENLTIAELRDQNARLKSGKATVRDKLQVLMTTTPLDFVLTNRPKK